MNSGNSMTGQKLESTESLKTGLESPEKNIIEMARIIFYSPRSSSSTSTSSYYSSTRLIEAKS